VIMALARGMKTRIGLELKKEIDKGRLLIVTPFAKEIEYVTSKTAELRNQFMIELADKVVIGYASKGGMLEHSITKNKITRSVSGLYSSL
jgi:hypothetical protein